MRFQVIITPAEIGGFNVSVPALDGCYTHGKTQEEALENAKKAIVCYLEGVERINRILIKDGGDLKEVEVIIE